MQFKPRSINQGSFCSQAPLNSTLLENYHKGVQMGCWGLVIYAMTAATCSGNRRPLVARSTGMHLRLNCSLTNGFVSSFPAAILQKYLDNFDLSIKIIYILGTLAFSIGIDHNTVRGER